MKFRDNYQNILENYTSIVKKQRFFYPRNFELSPEFTKAFQKEYARLKEVYGTSGNDVLRKINKALLWLIR